MIFVFDCLVDKLCFGKDLNHNGTTQLVKVLDISAILGRSEMRNKQAVAKCPAEKVAMALKFTDSWIFALTKFTIDPIDL